MERKYGIFDTNAFGHTKRGNEDMVFIAPYLKL